MSYKYNVLAIIRGTTVDGPGFRTSIYLAGCRHACPGCHNQQSWNPDGGEIMTADDILEVVDEEDFDVTLSGGDPLFNPESTKHLVDLLAERGRKVWIYTGFTWERIVADDMLMDAVRNAAVVVDGPFIERLKDPDLPFRGSSNQRLINVAASLSAGKATIIPA
ncbi:MAG: anaerobic ribonucleoside-triphosphate reductase activating protein [Muribaculaceae bacterium]|nr:anaerobic ribonucleoside-triphosphate reductase activating protein [Muribaculaceae bacterium]